ncbi:Mediator complex subunit 22 [Aphelenchoides besseyi]|nr:Mediator complex subunit 22 [Aphelenchoides besseyi]
MRKQQTSRSTLSKQQLINEYRSRLRQSTRAFSDHITKIAHAAKIPTEESALKASSTALVSEHYTLVNELSTRAALMARAADEILKLTNDIREFLILRDFNFISHAIEKNMETYSDGWKEFRSALQLIRKKLLKKPNYADALVQLREISVRMLDQEMHEHAAICHKESAQIYKEMGNRQQERDQWLKAAGLFASAYALQQQNQMSAHRFLQNEIYQQKLIMDKMCICTTLMKNFDEALYDTTIVFTNYTKGEAFPVREKMVEIELKLMVLHLKQFFSDKQERPKSWLHTYSTELPNRPSLMVREEFTPTREFIRACKELDMIRVYSIFHRDLRPRMDEFGQKLTEELIFSIRPAISATNSEIQSIRNDESISELEKRKLMFEWYNTLMGEGFHRLVRTNLKISSVKRLIDCRVTYYFEIPRGAYVDSDALNVSLLNHCHLCMPFNVEVPEHDPQLENYKPVLFQAKETLRKVFLFEDKLEFPIHFRYKRPTDDQLGMSSETIVPQPRVYLHCASNETLMAEESCRKNVQKLACGCKARPRCHFFHLDYVKQEPLKASVPIGFLWQATMVTYITLFTVFATVIYIMWPYEQIFFFLVSESKMSVEKKNE